MKKIFFYFDHSFPELSSVTLSKIEENKGLPGLILFEG